MSERIFRKYREKTSFVGAVVIGAGSGIYRMLESKRRVKGFRCFSSAGQQMLQNGLLNEN
ncbi:hypothetical protein VSQ32_15025 [Lachnospiraceae bacterium KK002]